MDKPALTFFCELPGLELKELFQHNSLIDQLYKMQSGVSLGILDLSDERAEVVKQLNEAHIPVTAWLLLPKDQGYWFNLDNSIQASMFYGKFIQWSRQHSLIWERIGLDIEPDIREFQSIPKAPYQSIIRIIKRGFDSQRLSYAIMDYRALITSIHADGYPVEIYHFPIIIDERKIGSTILQKLSGILDLNSDREILMLYSSALPAYGDAVLSSYAHDAQAIAIGSTGGGVQVDHKDVTPMMSWENLKRDLLIAKGWNKPIYIFCLEGCLKQNYFSSIETIDWNQSPKISEVDLKRVNCMRQAFQGFLWLSKNWLLVLLIFIGYRKLLKKITMPRSHTPPPEESLG